MSENTYQSLAMKPYPLCPKETYAEEFYGHTLEDPYHWLRDAKNPKVLSWVAAENAYTDEWFDEEELTAKIEKLKAQSVKPIYQMIAPWGERMTATVLEDGDYKVVSTDADFQDERLEMKRGDVDGFMPFRLEGCPVDPRYLLVTGAFDGAARQAALVMDSETKEILAKFDDLFYCVWSPTKKVVYYASTDTNVQEQTTVTNIYAYDLDVRETTVVLEEKANTIVGEILMSFDGRYLIFNMWQDYTCNRYYIYSESTGKITTVNSDAMIMDYLDSIGETHYFISRERNANGEILAVKNGEDITGAKVYVPAKEKIAEGGFAVDGKLYLLYMNNVCSELVCVDGESETKLELPSDMGAAAFAGRTKETVYLKFESLLDKPMLLALKDEKAVPVVKNEQEDTSELIVEQRKAPSIGDRKEIPYFIVHRKDMKTDGTNPTWLYAYGGYNVSSRPEAKEIVAQIDVVQWVKNGGVYILASIRGGSEFGTQWHEEGMLGLKKNCYYDFIGIVEQLIKDGVTSPEKIAISGMSNGGLMVSALVTMRPDLFGCVIDSVPHTDMIHFAEDDRGPMYITEYGNPKESEEMFEYLLSYSPYHNVRAESYPPILIQTGECDNNVPPYHGKKFAAKMQEMNRGENPVLLRVLEKGAHDRGAGEVFWKTVAEMQLFAEKALGISENE